MRNPIHYSNFREIKGADSLDTCDVDSKLARIRAALMMSVDSTRLAEVVLRCACVELIEREIFHAFDKLNTFELRRDGNCTAHPAIRAGTPADRIKFICQPNSKLYRSTVARGVVLFSLVAHRVPFLRYFRRHVCPQKAHLPVAKPDVMRRAGEENASRKYLQKTKRSQFPFCKRIVHYKILAFHI